MANPIVEMNVRDFGKITLQLAPDQAPISVNNFLYLVQVLDILQCMEAKSSNWI